MALKRNRWLVGGVLVVALGALLALSLLPIIGSIGDTPVTSNSSASQPTNEEARAELESRAKGYELVLEREPDNQTALRGLLETRIQLGDMEGVLAPLEKLAELNPDVSDYRILLGQTRQRLGDLEGAAQAYREVLDKTPGNMNALQGLVVLLLQQERPQAAIGLLQDTLKLTEADDSSNQIDKISVQLLLGQVYVEEARYEEALDLYDQAIAAAGQDFRPVLAKALVLKEMGQPEEAQALFDQALAMAPDRFQDQIEQLAAGGSEPADTLEAPAPEADSSGAAAGNE
ncbi:tetratricopeptide repeat domain protein [Halomicronema hongdechloris C2206]|uniref:Tetratricopeptide repeat domain protein n=1 Tax=Halomicronema hongdechloris C2206 TaxID=1641165 RepID=A0A1Z3HST1_9CYAN|nr:tetratricopeptide repeat protein [Halomicronema hongdechloris]ASC73358.1 tetratricopeptide repeat domain protein [Halomicronema hongdechloris C2206]